MFALLYCMIFGGILLQSYCKYKRLINIVSIFTFIWCFFGLVSSLGITGCRIPSAEVHLSAVTFVLIVDEIILLFTNVDCITPFKCNQEVIDEPYNIMPVQLFTWIMVIPMAIKSLTIFASTWSLAAVRINYFSSNNFDSVYESLFLRQMPMAMLNGMILICTFISFEKKQYKYLLIAAINTLIVSLVAGGRYSIMLLLYSFVIMWINDPSIFSNTQWIQKYKKLIRRIGVSVFILLIFLTANRGQDLFRTLFVYYAGSLSFLDYILEFPEQFALNQHDYGYMTFGFIFEPIVLLMKVLHLTEAKIPSYFFNIYCQNYYDIGDGFHSILINANTSVLYYYFKDFGFLGVCIGAVLVSSLTVIFFNNWKCKGSVSSGVMYLFMCNVLFNSIMTNQLFSLTPLFIVVTVLLCTKTKRFPIEFKLKR